MESIFVKEKRYTLVDRVLEQLREAIKSGKLRPGDRIIEKDLAQQIGISRITVREAMRSLEKEGLVTSIPFKGAQVTTLTKKDLEEIYHLRLTLEELAIRTLINNLNAEKIGKLESVVKEMQQTAKKGSIEEIIEVDLKFHRSICELCENTRLLNSWMNLYHQLRAFIAASDRMYGDDKPEITLGSHYPVLDAIKARDGDLAVDLMNAIITHGYTNVLQHGKLYDATKHASERIGLAAR